MFSCYFSTPSKTLALVVSEIFNIYGVKFSNELMVKLEYFSGLLFHFLYLQ